MSGEGFAALHRAPHAPLVLPNAWDHASAWALAEQGFTAIGTTSLGVAAAAGLPDGAGTEGAREETVRLVRRLQKAPFAVSVDIEGGFSDDPAAVADLARELSEAGAVGINLEDGLGPPTAHAEKIAAVKDAAPGLFVNARTDTHWLPLPGLAEEQRLDEALDRLAGYRRAGADGAFVPGVSRPADIARLVAALAAFDVPLNVLHTPALPPLSELASLGVGRVSLGSLLFRRALGAAVEAAVAVRGERPVTGYVPSYEDVAALQQGVAVDQGRQQHGDEGDDERGAVSVEGG
ncbi:isocitrate lyase/phosphoenolpyruvate mutase family protein [Streptomyces sp. NPDC048172]|uniref:isocitrate lyase/PEP mutase family protein n=1 Tax=Streptomyces sp. NPDC048172 TaxID=3365505 RepID=UPI003710DA73